MKVVLMVVLALAVALTGALTFANRGPEKPPIAAEPVVPNAMLADTRASTIGEILLPVGFRRTDLSGFGQWLRGRPLLPADSQLLDWNGKPVKFQYGHYRIVDLSVPKLQQCSDSIQRLRAEWLWEEGRQREISFQVDGQPYPFRGNGRADLTSYLRHVASRTSTTSMAVEMPRLPAGGVVGSGDVLIHPASAIRRGHVVLVVDEAVDQTGRRLLLIGQGFNPAKQFHLIKNSKDRALSPWHDAAILNGEGLRTPSWLETYKLDDGRTWP